MQQVYRRNGRTKRTLQRPCTDGFRCCSFPGHILFLLLDIESFLQRSSTAQQSSRPHLLRRNCRCDTSFGKSIRVAHRSVSRSFALCLCDLRISLQVFPLAPLRTPYGLSRQGYNWIKGSDNLFSTLWFSVEICRSVNLVLYGFAERTEV